VILALQDKIIVEKIDVSTEKHESGLFVVTSEKDATTRARVKWVGEGYLSDGKVIPLSAQVGDVVIFNQTTFSAPAFKYKNRYYLTITEKEILAVIRGED